MQSINFRLVEWSEMVKSIDDKRLQNYMRGHYIMVAEKKEEN